MPRVTFRSKRKEDKMNSNKVWLGIWSLAGHAECSLRASKADDEGPLETSSTYNKHLNLALD
jgi:hypothetical protein